VETGKKLAKLQLKTKNTAKDNEKLAGAFQKQFGAAGDPVASGLMQDTKIWAGKVQDAAKDAEEVNTKLSDALKEAMKLKGKDFTKYDNAKAAEDAIDGCAAATEAAEESTESLQKVYDQVAPPIDEKRVKKSADQYYPIMYFIDKEFKDVPATCGGDQVAKPVLGVSMDHCAASCDALPGKCVGFGYFGRDVNSICILYSKFKNAQYYTGCGSKSPPKKGPPKKKPFFLQLRDVVQAKDVVVCQAKLQSFDGLNLTPKDNGKCDICLKELTKANRCYK